MERNILRTAVPRDLMRSEARAAAETTRGQKTTYPLSPSRAATCATSLSPRPLRLTMISSSGLICGARRITSAPAGELCERAQRLVVGRVSVFDPLLVPEPGMFGADRRVVQSGGDAVRKLDLSELILEQVGVCALQDAE